MPVKIKKSIRIKENREVIFDFTQDYSRRLKWDNFLKKAELINAKTLRKDVKAWCVSKYGLEMETKYLSFNHPKVTAVKQNRKSLWFSVFSGSWRLEEIEKNKTEVCFTYSSILNFPFNLVQWLINSIWMKKVEQRLDDLKENIEKGKIGL